MRKILAILMILFAAAVTTPAQTGATWIEVGPTLTIPIGNLGDIADLGVGVIAGMDYAYDRRVTLTAHSGYIWYSGKGNWNVWEVPLLAGVHFHFTPNVYWGAEAGAHILHRDIGAFDHTDTKLSLVPMVGYQKSMGTTMLDLNGEVGILEDGSYVGARLGFMFGGR
jgi:hypothetical protein